MSEAGDGGGSPEGELQKRNVLALRKLQAAKATMQKSRKKRLSPKLSVHAIRLSSVVCSTYAAPEGWNGTRSKKERRLPRGNSLQAYGTM